MNNTFKTAPFPCSTTKHKSLFFDVESRIKIKFDENLALLDLYFYSGSNKFIYMRKNHNPSSYLYKCNKNEIYFILFSQKTRNKKAN